MFVIKFRSHSSYFYTDTFDAIIVFLYTVNNIGYKQTSMASDWYVHSYKFFFRFWVMGVECEEEGEDEQNSLS